jgi:hypothetical protein
LSLYLLLSLPPLLLGDWGLLFPLFPPVVPSLALPVGGDRPVGCGGFLLFEEPVIPEAGVVAAGHLSLLGMTEPSGHNFFLPFKSGGLFGFNVDCVVHLPFEFGCDPSGQVLVVGVVGGGANTHTNL